MSKSKLSPASSIEAIVASARRASAAAIAQRRIDRYNANKAYLDTPAIQRTVGQITKALMGQRLENRVVVREKPLGTSAYAQVSIYDKEAYYCSLHDPRAKKPCPLVRFVFYASALEPDKLGSVALYGADVETYALIYKNNRSFCGVPVQSVTLKSGLRPFVDINFRA